MNTALQKFSTSIFSFERLGFKSADAIDADIDDELNFHLECRTDELIAAGLDTNSARTQAELEFGSLDKVRKSCQQVGYGRRLLLSKTAFLMLLVFSGLTVWLTYALLSQRSANIELLGQLQAAHANLANHSGPAAAIAPEILKNQDLKGVIKDQDGNPVEDAQVLLIYKSWPGGRFRMENLATRTNARGQYNFENAYENSGDTEFLVTAIAKGHCLTSEYIENKRGETVSSFDFNLKTATSKQLKIIGKDGQPLSDSNLILAGRKTEEGEDQLVYAASFSKIHQLSTDADGTIDLSYFAAGDTALLYFDFLGEPYELKIDAATEQTLDFSDAGNSIIGQVKDQEGNAIADAKVLLIFKSWPNSRFQMQNFNLETDDQGNFSFQPSFKEGENCEFLITVIADGYLLTGDYVENPEGKLLEPLQFELEKAIEKSFKLVDSTGDAIADTQFYVSSRKPKDQPDSSILVYGVSARHVMVSTDREGLARLDHFADGDLIQLTVTSGSETKEIEVEIDNSAQQTIDISKKKVKRFR